MSSKLQLQQHPILGISASGHCTDCSSKSPQYLSHKSWLSFCFSSWVFADVCVCSCVHGGQKETLVSFSAFYIEVASLTWTHSLVIYLVWPTSLLQGVSYIQIPSAEIKNRLPCLCFAGMLGIQMLFFFSQPVLYLVSQLFNAYIHIFLSLDEVLSACLSVCLSVCFIILVSLEIHDLYTTISSLIDFIAYRGTQWALFDCKPSNLTLYLLSLDSHKGWIVG